MPGTTSAGAGVEENAGGLKFLRPRGLGQVAADRDQGRGDIAQLGQKGLALTGGPRTRALVRLLHDSRAERQYTACYQDQACGDPEDQ
ncbi:hypothetical protein [Pseudofrankia inefficax]|uniref:hypothetical protein n=1 Tax=Pseudofrankia inefficax (strain DSM 45817 / CECT 9037 / DDB 130130 / EuI1c) TaxID=298654 RepID=UPI0012FDC79B|nr:hypothetical protein [Pseudofrankia inefficax]